MAVTIYYIKGITNPMYLFQFYLRSQADWREQKAAEYPEDDRNARAADYLNEWAEWLDNHAHGDALFDEWNRIHPVELVGSPEGNVWSEDARHFIHDTSFHYKGLGTDRDFQIDTEQVVKDEYNYMISPRGYCHEGGLSNDEYLAIVTEIEGPVTARNLLNAALLEDAELTVEHEWHQEQLKRIAAG